MGLAVVWVFLASAPVAHAQACNSDLTAIFNGVGLNLTSPPAQVQIIIDNDSVFDQFFPTVYFRPNCLSVDSARPASDDASCVLDNGLGGFARPFALDELSVSHDCPGVTDDFDLALDPEGLRTIEFFPNGVILPPLSSCTISFDLLIDNFPDGFIPPDQGDTTVLQTAGHESECLNEGEPGTSGNLKSSSVDSGGTAFAQQTCGAAVDKQVSCDGGATWHDVAGVDDADGLQAAGCTGWGGSSPPEVKVRYVATNLSANNNTSGNALENCTLVDSNGLVPGAPPIGTLGDGFDGFIGFGAGGTAALQCSDEFAQMEPNTATLVCECPADSGGPQVQVTVTDQAEIECQEPAIQVIKSCEVDPEFGGPYEYFVSVVNPVNPSGASLQNCVISDPGASCDGQSIPGILAPGESSAEVSCVSDSDVNTATVTCEIVGAFDAQGQPKTISDEATAECCAVQIDKRVSCTGGGPGTYLDRGFEDGVIEGCTGWLGDSEIMMAYVARTTKNVSCTLTDSNPLIPDPDTTFEFGPGGNVIIHFSPLLECTEELLEGEPDTAMLSCECVDQPEQTASDEDSATVNGCEEPALEVMKECTASPDAQGNFTYEVSFENPANANGATLANCVLSDPGASCDGEVFAGPFAPGAGDTTTCTSASSSSTVTVTCDIVGSNPRGGAPKTLSSEDTAECIELDKQVSCDGGLTWHDVTGSDDADGFQTEGCTGWFDPSDPSVGQEIKFRYIARVGGDVTGCVLTDSNGVVIGAPIQIGDLAGGTDDVIYETDLLECNQALLDGEPNTGTLTCTGSGGETVSDDDTATVEGCFEPSLEVSKSCEVDPEFGGPYEYFVTATNPANANGASLQSCVISDPGASCDGQSIPGILAPGESSAEVSCVSDSDVNTATVTCEIVGAFDAQGQPKTISNEATAECCAVQIDKRVSCTGGGPGTYLDRGFEDGVIEGCTGWLGDSEIMMAYVARTTKNVSCTLTDSNPLIPDPDTTFEFGPGGNVIIHFSPLLECTEELLEGEPDTAMLSCECVDQPEQTASDEDSATVNGCEEPALDVTKECTASRDAQGNFTYEVSFENPANANGATLANCVVSDPGASCDGEVFAGPFAPGQGDTTTCTSTSSSSTVTVTCDIVGSNPRGGAPKTLSSEDTAECIELDKQVSCDGGLTWHDVTGSDDADGFQTEGCTGWFDPSDPSVGQEIKFRYIARVGGDVTGCVLTDSNGVVIGAPVQIGDLAGGTDDVIYETDLLECNQALLDGEPNTGTLTCTGSGGETVSDDDTATVEGCLEPALEVSKSCEVDPEFGGPYEYFVTATNPANANGASLQNCVISDPGASCDGQSIPGILAPGESSAEVSCVSDSDVNTATVTCEIVGAFDAQGQPKTISNEATAECCAVQIDKRVSCTGGGPGTYLDRGFEDGVIEGCTGWLGDSEIMMAYVARTTKNVSCTLTDSNPLIPDPDTTFEFGPGGNVIIHFSPLLECTEELLEGEPDTAMLSCECVDQPEQTASDEDSATVNGCEEPALDVTKECTASRDAQGNFTYEVSFENPANANGATLANCVVSDPGASCDGEVFAGPFAPGQGDTTTCTSTSSSSTVTVTCDIVGSNPRGGAPKTLSSEDTAECIELDKQVSCDGGLTWHDVTGSDDADGFQTEGCTGWFDPSDPSVGQEIKFRYIARVGGDVTGCVLTDSNGVVIGAPVQIGDLAGGTDDVIYETDLLECNQALLDGEPNTGTLTCTGSGGETVSDDDTATVEGCLEPALDVVKECTDQQDAQGNFIYTVVALNVGTASLANCTIDDPGADCDPLSLSSLGPGDTASASCRTPNLANTAKVVCEIVGANFPDGSPKTVSDEDADTCECAIDLDKQVSCDGGASWNDVTGVDDPDGSLAEGCIGWTVGDPEVKVRYLARSNASARCELTDSNTAIFAGPMMLDLTAGVEEVVTTDLIECNESQVGWAEPNTATLSCECLDATGAVGFTPAPVEDSANITCQTPSLTVEKACEPDADVPGTSLWTVTVENPDVPDGATLDNCQVDDIEVEGCDGTVGPLAPGESVDLTCSSEDIPENTVSVTCDIVGSIDSQTGNPKTISDEATEAECGQICDVQIDRQVSCDGGTTFVDVGFDDDPVVEACDGKEPGPVKVRWVAQNNSSTENLNCFLTDGNENLGVIDTEVTLPPVGTDDVILMSEIAECSELFVAAEDSELGVQAVLVCECVHEVTGEVFGEDTDTDNAGFGCEICLPKLDFEELNAGDIVTEQFAGIGVHVTTDDPINHPAMVFDSANPTGGDLDLGTPNGDFGGAGVGAGGEFGQPGQNSVLLGKVLILTEDLDQANPNDNDGGGTIVFTFDDPVTLHSVGILDVDADELAGMVTVYDSVSGGGVIAQEAMQSLGDNSYQDVLLEISGARRLEVSFPSSGAVASVVFCPEFCVEEAINDGRVEPDDSMYAFSLPGISNDFIFEPSGGFVEFDDGTASLTGTIRNFFDLSEAFTVNLVFSDKTDVPPAGSPVKDLLASAYTENGGSIDSSTWSYYPVWSGTLTGIESYTGAQLTIERSGPSFQIGDGANNKNTNNGGSGTFEWLVVSQPSDPNQVFPVAGIGDISIEILCECLDPPVLCDDGRPRILIFEYTGEDCGASDNDQDTDSCSGDPNGAEPVSIELKNNRKFTVDPALEAIMVGDIVVFSSANGGRMNGDLEFTIRQGASDLQTIKLHTSCSQPLNIGDQFGSMILRAFVIAP